MWWVDILQKPMMSEYKMQKFKIIFQSLIAEVLVENL